jgi:DNA-binding transcriptional regulator YiaG
MLNKRYPDCILDMSDCPSCSLCRCGKDCRNNPANNVAYLRSLSGMTQKQFSDFFEISKGTLQHWEQTSSAKNIQPWLLELIEYKLLHEGIIKY